MNCRSEESLFWHKWCQQNAPQIISMDNKGTLLKARIYSMLDRFDDDPHIVQIVRIVHENGVGKLDKAFVRNVFITLKDEMEY